MEKPIHKLKVMSVFGTRPEIIRLSRVLAKLDEYVTHIKVHTGQNYDYELNEIFFEDMGIGMPDYFLEASGGNACETIGKCIIEIDKVLEIEKPEALLILGDTNSALTAIAAKKRKIPIFHMEAGNRCFDQRVPEETNRKIVDHIADINLTYSDIAREYLLAEGLAPDRIIKTGSPMFEVLAHYKDKISASGILGQLQLAYEKYYVVSAHREENIDSSTNFNKLIEVLNRLAIHDGLPIIVTTHPRTKKKLDAEGVICHPLVKFVKPFGFSDYIHLQCNAKAVLSDSGTISEESSILNFPALNIREAHERPEGIEEGAVMLTGLNIERILQALSILDNQGRGDRRTLRLVSDYSMPNVSEKVLRIIHSYTDYINHNIWHAIS